MQEGQNVRQQVVERIRQSTSILVAVGNNPSVDALAAALGLSLMLNKLNKHTTAVFSGQTPAAIQFLEPNKTFENNVDALRDFIISLDKEKADRLRYKVEDDVVRIFITPYKTSISEKDLQFGQGDFNVDLIIALGVEKREELDKAIIAHGRILHDAAVVTINANNQHSSLGAIDYNDSAASSLCEMLVGMSESFQQPGLLDAQISTALLTGIVAATDRFSNPRTSPRVMTMAAQLMAAGANQQLIATNLESAKAIAPQPASEQGGPVAKQAPSAAPKPMQEEPPKKEPGELDITHEKTPEPAVPTPPTATMPQQPFAAPAEQTQAEAEKELEAALPQPEAQHTLLPELQKDLENAAEAAPAEPSVPGSQSVNTSEPKQAAAEPPVEDYISSHGSWKGKRLEPPTLGGTLNATTEAAMEASKQAEDADRNKTLLTHPDDATGSVSKRKRRNRNKGKAASEVAPTAIAATPVLPAEPAATPLPPAPEPVEQPSVAEAPPPPVAPQPEPALQQPPAPTPPAPEPEFKPEPETMPALPPIPPAPEPLASAGLPAPEPMPVPQPAEPAPAPQPEPAPSMDDLQQEAARSAAAAAAAAQPAQSVVGDLDSARQAVSEALQAQPFNPSNQPLEGSGARPMPAMPNVPVAEPLSSQQLQSLPTTPAAAVAPQPSDLPPMPPMPPLPTSGTELPPAPDLPGLNAPLPPMNAPTPPSAPESPAPLNPQQPQQSAAPQSNDPGQFKIPGAQ